MYPSDFPHERDWSAFLHDIPEFLQRHDIPDSAKPLILGENARRFYRLPHA
jgi:predicted TIM-barrel fold metal-dependent hydrolase